MRLYFKYMSILLRSQLEYRASFWMLSLGQFFIPFSVFAGLYFMFSRFGGIPGWSFYETALIFGVIHMSFSLAECLVRGFDGFSTLVVSGDFDRLLVRPRGTVIQVLGSKFEFTRIGRMAQSTVVLVWAILNLPIAWTPLKILTLVMMIAGGALIFAGIFILNATLCFWTVQALEVANIFTDGGREMAQYPLNIYRKPVQIFFTFIIPFACVSYLPMLSLLGRANGHSLLYSLLPLASLLFLLPCLAAWRFGVRHYRGTGS
ncbi:hypothetical protein D3C81_385950 [compost metagenome]